MIRLFLSRTVCVASLAIGALATADCGSTPDASVGDDVGTGTLSVPLVTTTNGHTYRLSNAYISIWGTVYTSLSSYGGAETVLSTSLPTGDYDAELYNWALERDDGTGHFAPVSASLLTNYQSFSIANGATTTIVFTFQTDGNTVTVGSGTLDVKVQVQEVAPACTPFGADCGAGAWCPPSGLTGRGLACYAQGSVGLGQPCSRPGDCVANSTCLDLGFGAVCTGLCPSANVGASCSSGGVCSTCRSDYGVCMPGGGDAGVVPTPPTEVCPPPSVADGGPRPAADGGWW